eukprot:TRINITY_DN11036_c1_g1_i1.p1 TRINITY_DN11036_c1_g1~~TRINITY_DN11036_c1_g1_i1.p1  ORF type:complete len:764 (-),score=41.93 TRINITY_DN11036_c1_g1_i1:511-2469(-)
MEPEGDGGMYPNNNKCSCSALIRVPKPVASSMQYLSREQERGPLSARSVVYMLFDDLRPELPGAYGHDFVHAPNVKALMERGTVFRRAYAQIAVCAPSRMSFLTGRRPTTTRSANFLDHIRQADCGINRPNREVIGAGDPVASFWIGRMEGGSGQCCTFCSTNVTCSHWTYADRTCKLYTDSAGTAQFVFQSEAISGVPGHFKKWTTLPEAFKKAGWLTMGTGKVFHPEERGEGPDPQFDGKGLPPNQDPPSWTVGLSMSQVSAVAPMNDPVHSCDVEANFSSCPVDATLEGNLNKVKTTENDGEFEDKIIANDAILKLRLAASVRKQSGQPFFLAVGFRKPHLSFRFPAPFLQWYPNVTDVPLAKYPELDASIPPIAHYDAHSSASAPGQQPWTPLEASRARQFRLYYAATISWADSQLGRVLDELDRLGLRNDTIIVMHSDHGYSLGEQGEWQKFTNFELGTRVPLVVHDPSKEPSVSDAVVELVDVMPTLMDLAQVPIEVLGDESLEGRSLRPLLGNNKSSGRPALSLYPRCPNRNHPASDPQDWWKENSCLFLDRTLWSVMGLSLRTERWRYTEWLWWDGAREQPGWRYGPVAKELYDHLTDDGHDFDKSEPHNLAEQPLHASIVSELAALLRKSYPSSLSLREQSIV